MTARRSALLAGSALALLSLVSSAVPVATAQDATPVAEEAATARPVHIHSGSCAELGDVVAPLTDLAAPAGEGAGLADSAIQAESSVTNVPLTLEAILGANYAINAHQSAEEIDVYVACGDIAA